MQFKNVVESRRSIRAYTDKPVDDAQLMQLLAYAHMAPSAGNLCPWEFVVIRQNELKEAVVSTTFSGNNTAVPQSWIKTAPVLVVICGVPAKIVERYGKTPINERELLFHDIGALVENFLLGAVDMGLASCYVAGFNKDQLARLLELPDGIEPAAILPLGYAVQPGVQRPRTELSTITHYEKF